MAPSARGHRAEHRRQLVVGLDRDGGPVERLDGPLGVGERDERVERADLGPGRHRRRQDLGAQGAAGVDHGLPAVHPEAAGERPDHIVRDGQDDQLDLLDQRLRVGEGPGDLDQRAEPLASTGVAAGHGVDRPAGPRQRHAERGADRARPDDPDDRWLARLRMLVRMGMVAGSGGWRSIPAASMAASVSARSRSGSSPGRLPHGLIADRPPRVAFEARRRRARKQAHLEVREGASAGANAGIGRLEAAVRLHPSSVASE